MRVCKVVSNVDRAVAFEWIVDGLRHKHQFSFILIGPKNSFLSKWLREKGIEVYEIEYRGKRDALRAVVKCFSFLRKRKFDVVHTHLVEATLYALLPAWVLRIKKRIYTRHHSDYNYKYSPKGIKYDKISNWLATDIIAISGQVKKLLIEREGVSEKKITLIPHGIDIGYFENFDPVSVNRMAAKYNPEKRSPVIGVIARQTHWKGIQYVIPAFAEILKSYPNALLLLANAHGDYAAEIDRLLQEYLPETSYVKIKYEYDNASLYQLIDILVHVPVDDVVEAFGQVYVEALAAKIPCVFTLSGIAVDCIESKKNAIVVPYCDSTSISEGILQILGDDQLRSTLIENAAQMVHEKFALGIFLDKLNALYENKPIETGLLLLQM